MTPSERVRRETKALFKRDMICSLQVNTGNWCQESYESSTRDADRRAKQLRLLGYVVHVMGLGLQVTALGSIRMSIVDVRPGLHDDTYGLPTDGWREERFPR